MSGDPEQEYFADGMVEDIITALVALQGAVRDRPQFELHLQGQGRRREAGRARARRPLRAGRQRAQGGNRCASPDSSSMPSRARIFGPTFRRRARGHLRSAGPGDRERGGRHRAEAGASRDRAGKRKPTESLDAYDYYLRGMASLHQWTQEANSEALQLFYRAIELDPEFRSAYGMAAWCYAIRK